MTPRESAVFGATPKSVTGLAIAFLVLAGFFGFLNTKKVKALRTNAANAQAVRDAAEHGQANANLNAPPSGTAGVEQGGKVAGAEDRAAKAEAELAQVQKEKTDLQAKLDANQQEIASLQKAAEASKNANPPVAGSSPTEGAQTAELQSQVDDLRRQLDSAEKEKTLLAEKIHETQERTSQPKETKKRRETGGLQRDTVSPHRAGVHGTVLAYNQAYNLVVLNLGARK